MPSVVQPNPPEQTAEYAAGFRAMRANVPSEECPYKPSRYDAKYSRKEDRYP